MKVIIKKSTNPKKKYMAIFYENKKSKTDSKRKPRQELSKSASRGLNTAKHRIILDFD